MLFDQHASKWQAIGGSKTREVSRAQKKKVGPVITFAGTTFSLPSFVTHGPFTFSPNGKEEEIFCRYTFDPLPH